MRLTISALGMFMIGLFFTSQCNADNGISHSSKINGVSLFWMFLTTNTPPQDLLADGDEKELVTHCNGKNKVYIYELASKGFVCQSAKAGQNNYEINILGVKETDVVTATHLTPDQQGIFTISRTPIPQHEWTIESLSEGEIVQLQALSKNKFQCPTNHPCRSLSGMKYDKSLELYEGQIQSMELEKLAINIKGSSIDVLIAPIAVELVGDVDGGTVVFDSAVFSKIGKTIKFYGQSLWLIDKGWC